MHRKVIDPSRHLPRPGRIPRRTIPLTWNGRFDQREHSPVAGAGYGDGVVSAATEELAACWKFELCDGSSMMGEVSELFVVRILKDMCAGERREGRRC
jgi:hypothetical protein